MVSPPVPNTMKSSLLPGCEKHNGVIYDSLPSGIVSAAITFPVLASSSISTPGKRSTSEYGAANRIAAVYREQVIDAIIILIGNHYPIIEIVTGIMKDRIFSILFMFILPYKGAGLSINCFQLRRPSANKYIFHLVTRYVKKVAEP